MCGVKKSGCQDSGTVNLIPETVNRSDTANFLTKSFLGSDAHEDHRDVKPINPDPHDSHMHIRHLNDEVDRDFIHLNECDHNHSAVATADCTDSISRRGHYEYIGGDAYLCINNKIAKGLSLIHI